jgi:hypothetical protein
MHAALTHSDGGTNSITITSPTENLFFRLQHQQGTAAGSHCDHTGMRAMNPVR